MKNTLPLLATLLLFPLATLHSADAPAKKTNIVVILTDDLAFADLGCYGSEIETPNLDRLATNGVRFTQFYNTAKCHSSRVSLLTGLWCRQAGNDGMSRAVTLAEVLAPAGYFTAMTGKWHLKDEPTDFGFQRYFGHLSGMTNYFKGNKYFRLNGKPWTVPEQGFYTTVANVDHALNFLGEARAEKKPWLLYIAFNAPHSPLQPLEADYKKYLGRYDAGWDTMRAARLAKQKQLGLFGRDVEPAPRPDYVPAWDALKPELRTWEARRMAAYAGMIDRVDQEIGRLMRDIEAKGEIDNTIVMFFSDNGACAFDTGIIDKDREPYDPDTHWNDSTGWAWARNSPFRLYKQNQFEGGIASPAIIHWPAGIKLKPGALVHSPAHLVDVLPTLAEVAGATVPDTYPGRSPTPLVGVSLAPILEGKEAAPRPPIHLMFSTDRGLRDGNWKLVSFQSQPWELYNIKEDRTELHDLAAKNPDIVARMEKQWHQIAKDDLRAIPKEQAPVAKNATGYENERWSDYTGAKPPKAAQNVKKKRPKKAAKPTPTVAPADK